MMRRATTPIRGGRGRAASACSRGRGRGSTPVPEPLVDGPSGSDPEQSGDSEADDVGDDGDGADDTAAF
eukprot:3305941-Alexandrium_andersonii.AAC.1